MTYEPSILVGVATPQANPTVEAELRHLLPRDVLPVITRLTSRAATLDDRLVAYFKQLDRAVASFGDLVAFDRPFAALGFACTGSSYLVGRRREADAVERCFVSFGVPVVTATAAIRDELARRNVRRIVIVAPYPESLGEAAERYWQGHGIEVVRRVGLTAPSVAQHPIYGLRGSEVTDRLRVLDVDDADAVLLSGTGMPTLAALWELGRFLPIPLLSSNLCLAFELLRRAGRWNKSDPVPPPPWRIE